MCVRDRVRETSLWRLDHIVLTRMIVILTPSFPTPRSSPHFKPVIDKSAGLEDNARIFEPLLINESRVLEVAQDVLQNLHEARHLSKNGAHDASLSQSMQSTYPKDDRIVIRINSMLQRVKDCVDASPDEPVVLCPFLRQCRSRSQSTRTMTN